MSQTFYNNSVASFQQGLRGVKTVLDRGRSHYEEQGQDLEELVRFKLRDDMAPFSFQVISVWHQSMGALRGMEAGVFSPPPKMTEMTYAKCEGLVDEAIAYVDGCDPEEIEALSGRDMVFSIGGREIPFTTDNFLASFSLPNFFFHATTTYAILRMHGVPLGKVDFLGPLRVSV